MSDVGKCPSCEKYFDATFAVQNCPKCGADLRAVDLKSHLFADTQMSPEDAAHVQTYIVLSCISFLFCGCLGLVAIIFSLMSMSAKKRGDLGTAESHANTAKILSIVSIVLGVLGIIGRFAGKS